MGMRSDSSCELSNRPHLASWACRTALTRDFVERWRSRRAAGRVRTAAVRPGKNLQQVPVGVFEVQAAAAIAAVDRPLLALARVCPVRQAVVADTAKSCVELFLSHQEGVVLGGDLPAGLGEIQRDAVVGLDDEEMCEAGSWWQAKDPGEERR